jgi:protein N-terminal glutamine amidohydrolase
MHWKPSMDIEESAKQRQQEHLYKSCYCEENIWHLCQEEQFNQYKQVWIVFISSVDKCVAIAFQQAAKELGKLVFWDYHVVLVTIDHNDHGLVWDLDSYLPFPSEFKDYRKYSFVPNLMDPMNQINLSPMFRAVKRSDFLQCFYSDRSHMINPDTLEYLSEPPDWPCCSPVHVKSVLQVDKPQNIWVSLQDFRIMNQENDLGLLLSYSEFLECSLLQ